MSQCCHCGDEAPCAAKIGIFRQLSREDQARVSALTLHQTYPKGALLFSPEDNPGLYLISQGRVKVYSLSPTGKETLLRVLQQGDFVGEGTLFGSSRKDTFGQALTELHVCLIRREDFLGLLREYPSISLKLLEELNRRLEAYAQQAAAVSGRSIQERLVRYLLDLSRAQESTRLRLPLSGKELSAFLGTTPETLSRRVRSLESQGLLQKSGREVVLLDPDGLESLL